MKDITVFVCNRGGLKPVKIQLELDQWVFDAYKEKAKETKYTPKQIMENMLRNWVDGAQGSGE